MVIVRLNLVWNEIRLRLDEINIPGIMEHQIASI